MYVLAGLTTMVYAYSERDVIDIIHKNLKAEGPITAELLSGGLSGSMLFKVKTLEQTYVVRFWNMQWAEYFPQDLACQIVASNSDYGPKLFFTDERSCISVMEYLKPEVLPENEKLFKALADLLKRIHTGPEIPKGFDRSFEFDESIKEVSALNLEYINLALISQVKKDIFDALQHDAHLAPCHGDLHPRNIIFSKGQFFAVDYTWGGMADPYWDLAAIAIFNCRTSKEEMLLLKFYLDHEPTSTERAHFSLAKTTTQIFYGFELLKLAPKHLLNTVTPRAIEKSYMEFANDSGLNPDNFPVYGFSLIEEAVSYICSQHYSQDLINLRSN